MAVRRSLNSFAAQVKRLPHRALYRREERLRLSDSARLDAEIARIAGDAESLRHAGDARDYGLDMHVIRFDTADKAREMQAWLDASDISNWPAPALRSDIEQLKVGGGR
ncbi:MAG: hypothetical protein LCH93_13885 [Proteobacteria bacterium]|nr:hypothetical protein [Pseudomonadota bacterium]